MGFNLRRCATTGVGLRKVIGAGAVGLCLGAGSLGAVAADFTLRERLGHAWSNECVTFSLTPAQAASARQGKALVGPGGQETAYQIVGKGSEERLVFQANLPPYATADYSFSDAASVMKTDLAAEDVDGLLRMGNSRIGIEVRKALKPGEGPLARLRLGSGLWTGGATLEGGGAVSDYTAEVVARGPVFAEVVCRVTFADRGTWTLSWRLESGEPVVRVDEQFDAPTGGLFCVALGDKAFKPTHLIHRNSAVESPEVRSDPIADFLLQPWLRWNNPRHGNWIALPAPGASGATAEDHGDDMLMAGVIRPSFWRDPQWKGRAPQGAANVRAAVRDGVMTLELPVQGGRRVWLLGALEATRSLAILNQKNKRVAAPPQQLIIKHGDFPLDRVKDYVLDWEGDEDSHPNLYIRKQDLPALRASLRSDPVELNRWANRQPIDKYYLDGPIREFVATGDAKLGRRMAEKGAEYLQVCVNWYLKQDERLTIGSAPHMQTLITTALNLLDPVLSTDAVTPEARKRILAQIAFLGYVVNSPDYWSVPRGFDSFANMTAVVALFQTQIGCMLPSHPLSRPWAEQGLTALKQALFSWSDSDGGWVEAPHYAMVSYDILLGAFMMAANAGISEDLYDPRMRKVAEWFASISTPRDSRVGGFRHLPPIGNTYHGEPTGVYGLLAGIWKDRDPQFAARMQWMFEQSGSFPSLGIGWNFPTMLGYRFLFSTHQVAPQPADFGSAWFEQTGVVLRNTMHSERETYLHLIAGTNHAHYDYDSGSIILYGKGRVLADDWGYKGRMPDKWHSLLTSSEAGGGEVMQVNAFAPGAALDYVSGQKGAWKRQIAFVKDADPLGPTFFLLRDSHEADVPATWRLWLTASEVRVHENGATVIGTEDVDLDVFLYQAAGLNLQTESGSQNLTCGYRDGKEGPLTVSQTALVAALPGRGAVVALLYPRLKTEPAPTVAWSADGRMAEVASAAGTDYVVVATDTQEAISADRDVSLQGTAGVVQVRPKTVTLTLGAAGKLRIGDRTLAADKATARTESR